MPAPNPVSESGQAGHDGPDGESFDVALTAAKTIARWRAGGMAGHDPVRLLYIEALARRAAAYQGDARRVLDGKLLQALESYRSKAAASVKVADANAEESGGAPATQESLADLLDTLAAGKPAPAELKAVSRFRSTWSRLGVEQRLSQSRAKMPDKAGPLNSHALVLRSLNLMREMSPEYLTRFIGHVDALLWLEQANGGQAVLQKDVLGAEAEKPRKSGRGRSKAG